MRRLGLAFLAACASRSPAPAPDTPPVASPTALNAMANADAGAPAWPHESETMLAEAIETNQLFQTRTHIVWIESADTSDTSVLDAVVALDKKTLAKRTIHSRSMPIPKSRQEMMQQGERFRMNVSTTDDAVFVERASETLRITLDDKPPARLPNSDDPQCADAASMYRIRDSKTVTVTPFRKGASTRFPLTLPPGTELDECQVFGDSLYLFLHLRDEPKEWSAPRGFLGRVPTKGGAFESVVALDGPGANALASDGAFAFRTRPHSDPMFGHILLLEPGKPMRILHKTHSLAISIAVNRTHVCWDESFAAGAVQIVCGARDGGEPTVAVENAGPLASFFLLDDDYLVWLDTKLRRIRVPR